MGWVTCGSSRVILVGLGNLRFLQVNIVPLRTQYYSTARTVVVSVSSRGELEKLMVKELRLLLVEEDYNDNNNGGGRGGGL